MIEIRGFWNPDDLEIDGSIPSKYKLANLGLLAEIIFICIQLVFIGS